MFTWGCSKLEEIVYNNKNGSSCGGGVMESLSRKESSHKHRLPSRKDSINLSSKVPSTSISKVLISILVNSLNSFVFPCPFHSLTLYMVAPKVCCCGSFTKSWNQVF